MPTSRCARRVRSNCIAKFGLTPDSLMDLWIRTLAKHGIDSFWIYDCLYNMDKMERLCRVVADAGCEVVPAIMYGISPVHTDEWFADGSRVRQLGDHRRDLLRGRGRHPQAGTGEDPHAGAGRGGWRRADRDAVPQHRRPRRIQLPDRRRSGIRILHTGPVRWRTGRRCPSTEQTVENLRWEGHDHGSISNACRRISEHMRARRRAEGHPIGVPNEYNVVPVPPPTSRWHDRHAQGAARPVRHVGSASTRCSRRSSRCARTSAIRSRRRRSRS